MCFVGMTRDTTPSRKMIEEQDDCFFFLLFFAYVSLGLVYSRIIIVYSFLVLFCCLFVDIFS